MTLKRRAEVERLYHAALSRDDEDRAAFLGMPWPKTAGFSSCPPSRKAPRRR